MHPLFWQSLKSNDQHLMAGSNSEPILWANGACHCDTLHLFDAKREVHQRNQHFETIFLCLDENRSELVLNKHQHNNSEMTFMTILAFLFANFCYFDCGGAMMVR